MRFTYDFAEVNGKVPMVEFLEGLAVKERAKVFASIEKLVELKSSGIPPKENLSKHLEDGIFELRVSFESRIARGLYFYEAERQLIFGVCQFLVEASVAPIRLSFPYAAADTASPCTRSMASTTPAI